MPRRWFSYGNAPPQGEFGDQQLVSIDFNGTDEEMGSDTAEAYDFGNAFTFACWIKPEGSSFTAASTIFRLKRSVNEANRISVRIMGATANDPFNVQLYDGAGVILKDYRWDSLLLSGTWNFVVFTWDGTDLLLYHEASLTGPTSTPTDSSGSRLNGSDMQSDVANAGGAEYYDGLIHSLGFWNVVLTDAEQMVLYNGGDGAAIDWASNLGGYTSSANLQHWWRLGHDAADMGADSGVAGAIDLMGAAANITSGDDIVANSPNATAGFRAQTACLDLNGTDEKMADTSGQTLDVANAFTVAAWFKPEGSTFTAQKYLMDLKEDAGNANRILFRIDGSDTNDPVRVNILNSTSGALKAYKWESLAVSGAWNFVVFTWDGTDLTLYHDGIETAPTTMVQDLSGTMVDGVRDVLIGGNVAGDYFEGRMHSIGLWSTALTSGEQLELYNSGDGNGIDWASDGVTYASSANLQHWWRLGRLGTVLGGDSGVGTAIDVNTNSENITTADDRVTDAP